MLKRLFDVIVGICLGILLLLGFQNNTNAVKEKKQIKLFKDSLHYHPFYVIPIDSNDICYMQVNCPMED